MRNSRKAAAGLAAAIAVTVSGCGGASTPAPSHPVAPARPVAHVSLDTGCRASQLPKGFTADSVHSGRLTARNYSASADVQAALLYDQLQAGDRTVYLHHGGGRVDGVVSCVAMRFATAHLASRFFDSYRALRGSAGRLVHRVDLSGGVPDLNGVTAYLERGQSFRGYHVASIDVVEAAGVSGTDLDIVSVAGTPPSRSLARKLLLVMSGGDK